MLFKQIVFITALILCATENGYAQQDIFDLEEMLLEQISEELIEDIDISEVLERLTHYQRHKLNINTVDERQLADLVFLSPQQVESIIHHRAVSGEFISLLELQGIRELDFRTIQLLELFVEVKSAGVLKGLNMQDIWQQSAQSLMLRYSKILEKAQGYKIDDGRSRYLGDPNRYAIRYRLNYENKILVSLNMEKDAGEPFFAEKQCLGFDFYSGHIALNNISTHVRQVIVGDYALQFGQGLILWNGLSFGKGTWIGSSVKQGIGLKPYSSMNENNFQRGIASTLSLGRFDMTPFVSYNKLSGNVHEDEGGDKQIVTINYSGLHRTPTEQSYRQAISQLNYGININYTYRRLRLGMTYLSTNFEDPVTQSTDLYRQFDFVGKSLKQLGGHYNFTIRNFYFFGETAKSLGAGVATNNGLIASLTPKMSVVASYRNYSRHYQQYFAQSIGEGAKVWNEKGVYAGLNYHPSRKIEWVNYVDVFRFPWLRYRVDAPSSGTDFLSQFSYSWYKKGVMRLRYRHRLRQENILPDNRDENMLADVLRDQLRTSFEYKISDIWSVKSRVEWTRYEKEEKGVSRGWLLYQDVFWRGRQNRLQSNVRFAYFNTNDYDARMYAYESDVLYAYGFPMYYDKGFRSYLNVRWRVYKGLDLWGRYALVHYIDRENIGSGLDKIDGNKRREVKLQLRWQW